ncbi:MAG: capsule assembly Wzi family protein [Niabella sp.]
MNKRILIVLFLWMNAVSSIFAQDSALVKGSVGLTGTVTSNNQVPFWMRTNQYGSIPLDGASASVIGNIYKPYRMRTAKSKFDWSAGAEIRINAGKLVAADLIEAFGAIKYGAFQLQAGRVKSRTGLVDPELSSGGYSISGNALGIPKIELSIPEFTAVPFTKKLLAVKGNLGFGDMGKLTVRARLDSVKHLHSYYHEKSLYLRIGKPGWKLKLYGGVNHEVEFGNEKEINGPQFDLQGLNYLWYVFSGQTYGGQNGLIRSKVGNHLGSVDQALSYDFKDVYLYAYHQFFYEVGGLYHLNNVGDGLWGISLQRKKTERPVIYWKKIVLEFIGSKDQGGGVNAKITPSGDEDYYNNYVYYDGWTYKGENLGNNLFTNKSYGRQELPSRTSQGIINNRLHAFYAAAIVQWKYWELLARVSYSRNFGTYGTSPEGTSLGAQRTVYPPPYFPTVNQFSGFISARRPLKNNFYLELGLAGDNGALLYNSIGGQVKLARAF